MKKLIFILFFVFQLFSCTNDILDKEPLDIISGTTVWSDPALIDAFLTQVYSQMYILSNDNVENGWPSGESGVGPMEVNELSDECKANWVTTYYGFKLGNLKISGGLLEWWEQSYTCIRSLNEFLQKVPEAPLKDDYKKERSAEARFLRAYNYFAMVKRYGGVPIITEPQSIDDPEDSLYPKRDTEKAVYDFIISEMDAIGNDLPETNTTANYGRPSKYAALALKCRAALYAGSIAQFGTVKLGGVVGIPAEQANSYYQVAYDAAKTIINSGHYSLYNKNPNKVLNFRNIFLDKKNPETIWARQHGFASRESGGNGWAYDFFQCPSPNAWGAGNQDGPYLEMIEEFEYIDGTSGKLDRTAVQQGLWTTDQFWANKDPRFFATIYTQNTIWKGNPLQFYYGLITTEGTIQTNGSYNGVLAKGNQVFASSGTGFGVMKYLDESKDNFQNTTSSGTDYLVFRYGEILLNFAEAAFELGKTAEALEAVNQVRSRAGIALLSTIDRGKIRHERKVELAFEGHRYWDQRRWRTAVLELSKDFSGLRYILDYGTGKYRLEVIKKVDGTVASPAFYERNYYFPITLNRTNINPNMVENPDYQ